MNTFLNDIRSGFSKPNNTLIKLLLINILVFIPLFLMSNIFPNIGLGNTYNTIIRFLAIPAHIGTFIYRPWTLITYFFLHEGFFHILFNMLNLYYFGQLIQEYLGHRKLLGLYIMGGIAGGLIYLLAYNLIPFYELRAQHAIMLGASASVLAIIVAAATLLPDYTFFLLLLGPVRIKWIALALVLLSLAATTGDNAGGNLAHIGGALFGFVFIRMLQSGTDLSKPVVVVWDWIESLTAPKPKVKVTYRSQAKTKPEASVSSTANGTPSQLEIDRILDKISKTGYESLSKDEKQKLFRASQGH